MQYPWLEPALARLRIPDRRPHALLLHGPAGIGKRALATALGRDVLCETPFGERPPGGCGTCGSCRWFDEGNHPDFRWVTTEEASAEAARQRGRTPDDDGERADGGKSKRAPSREIKVDQIRALQSLLYVGTHRDGVRVVQLEPLQALNDVAANALLKMLEEPPARTLFLLVADRLGGIPATILSRCRKEPLGTPPRDVALRWLREQGVADPEAALALAGGAPLAAVALADDAAAGIRRQLLTFLARPTVDAALGLAESFAREPVTPLIGWLQQWTADCVSQRLAARVHYHPTQAAEIAALAARAPIDALLRFDRTLAAARRSADHPLNPRLTLEGLFLAYADLFDVPPAAARAASPVLTR